MEITQNGMEIVDYFIPMMSIDFENNRIGALLAMIITPIFILVFYQYRRDSKE